jgi:hypothetical protein
MQSAALCSSPYHGNIEATELGRDLIVRLHENYQECIASSELGYDITLSTTFIAICDNNGDDGMPTLKAITNDCIQAV